ncbi:uncharacterized protein LOC129914893 [Episyrphus balteatus]|uniref:uncharacterized protein LOC129914893 n=1 Tax=Episyrphus balteatus TaxID=286459 RepID=UPI0024869847|nr:uncharacterized protein LOC129914893 [Episyrphus balteatus]
MFKVQLLISTILVLWITLTIGEDCLFQDQLWHADSNPKIFLYCDTRTNRTAVGSCPGGSGFVRNHTASGCIPWEDWNDACVTKTNELNLTCNENNYKRLQPAIDPEHYFLCTNSSGSAIKLKCPKGKAFYSQKNYLGCFGWDMWRNLTGCLR